jgi:putative membrane protein
MMRYDGFGISLIGLCLGFFIMICFLSLLILGVVLLIRHLRSTGQNNTQPTISNAMNILNERYAKGEISDEEYKIKKAEIKG